MHHSLVDSIDISLPKRVTGAPAFSPTIEAKYMESDRVSGRPQSQSFHFQSYCSPEESQTSFSN